MSSPSPAQYHGVKVLADNLNAALEKGAAAIQLEAYGGAPGDKSSDARRLSLRRALAVRQLLIDDGVPSARIDVRPMGGADDRDQPDRVDVFIRAGWKTSSYSAGNATRMSTSFASCPMLAKKASMMAETAHTAASDHP